MTLVKTSLLNAIAVAIKMLTLLGLNKILAVYVGPSGYAALGQFQNAVQMITSFASGAINIGVTKYTAEYFDDELRQRLVWRTAGTIALVGSLVTAVVIAIFNKSLASWFLKDASFGSVFLWFSATLVLFIFNTLLLAILNGKKDISRYVLISIVGSLFTFVVVSVMTVKLGLFGALVALAINQSISFFITLLLCLRTPWFKIRYLIGSVDKKVARNLGKYSAMALTSAVCVPISHILVRNHLTETIDLQAAGYWEAMWRLSAAYLMFTTATLSVYYLPRLSEIKTSNGIRAEIIQGYKIILPVAALCGAVIYNLRDFVIGSLFTRDFAPMRELFGWQIIGDMLKISSWLLGYILTAKTLTKAYIFSEIFFSSLFVVMVYLLIDAWGVRSAVIAHSINYLCHFIFMLVFLVHKKII